MVDICDLSKEELKAHVKALKERSYPSREGSFTHASIISFSLLEHRKGRIWTLIVQWQVSVQKSWMQLSRF